MADSPLIVRHLQGPLPYEPVWRAMQRFNSERQEDTADELWCLQHQPVFTQGQAGKAHHLINPRDIPVVQTDRGGQVTYHGPGQLVMYPLIALRRHRLGARSLVSLIEQSIIQTLAQWGIEGAADPQRPGVYVDGCKIASLGLRIRKGSSYHGLALNIDMDLEPFQYINPCGFEGLAITQMQDLCAQPVAIEAVAKVLIDTIYSQLNFSTLTETHQAWATSQ